MSWNALMGIASIIASLFPITVIFYHRLHQHRSLAALAIYYILMAVYNGMDQHYIPVGDHFTQAFGIIDNYLDIPLMLTSLLFFCPNKQKQQIVHILTALFIVYELVISFVYGFNAKAVVYIMGPGLGLVLIYTFYLFIRQIRFTVTHSKNAGRTLMLAAILFSYSCFAFVYYVYYIQLTPYVADTLLLYYISTFISTILMGTGIQLTSKRMKELESLKVTRKELAMFFDMPRKKTAEKNV